MRRETIQHRRLENAYEAGESHKFDRIAQHSTSSTSVCGSKRAKAAWRQ
jgi:hypothetical protein